MICILWDVCFVIVFVNVTVFSSAVLVYLNYKNAYEHWNEQRLALNKEVRIIYLLIFFVLSSIYDANANANASRHGFPECSLN